MSRNTCVQLLSRGVHFRRGFFTRFLLPKRETHRRLFGKYTFAMDLSLGRLQKVFFLKPDTYEPEMQEALRALVKPGMTVLDIGANTGYFSVLMADLVGPTGRVYSFEPFSINFKLLTENIRSNDFRQVQLFQEALSDKPGTAILHLNPVNDGGHSLGDFKNNPDLEGWDPSTLQETVKTETLDAFLADQAIGHVDLIKIDVEGAETLVFAGAEKLLSGSRAPIILCEVGDQAQEQSGKSEKDLRESLYRHGYKSYWLKRGFREFGSETAVKGLVNVLFKKE